MVSKMSVLSWNWIYCQRQWTYRLRFTIRKHSNSKGDPKLLWKIVSLDLVEYYNGEMWLFTNYKHKTLWYNINMWCNLWKKNINIAITFHDILVRNCNISDYCVVHLQSSLNIYVQYNQMITVWYTGCTRKFSLTSSKI